MVEIWTSTITNNVFTNLKNSFPSVLSETYSELEFTTESISGTPTKFPCVYLQRLPSYEMAQSLDGTTIPSGMFSFQVTVTDNSSQETAREIMDEVVTAMLKMHFEMVQIPISQSVNSLYIEVARFRRVIAEGDILAV